MKRGSFACQGCEKIQPVDNNLNYFELMGMPNMAFDLDLARLEKQYKLLQWNLHPDKVVLRPQEEQGFAAQRAVLINLAYSILRSPLSRANYMLSLRGIQAGEGFEGTIEDKELLMEVMEAREAVEDTDDVQQLRAMLVENQGRQREVVLRISAAFARDALPEVVRHTTNLTYLVKLEHEIKAKLPTA